MVKRFVDDNRSFYAYAYDQKIWVKCPKCGELAFVWGERIDDDYFIRCVCTNCLFRVNHLRKRLFVYQWYWQVQDNLQGYEGECDVLIDQKCPCKEGKFRFHQIYANRSHVPNVIAVACSFCQQVKHFDCKSDEVYIKKVENFQWDSDPLLNYPLYLCEPTQLGKIFAFQPDHLAQLKAYVTADLRENTHLYRSYFSKLPRWIKSAKNCDLVLKAIGKLEQKIAFTNQISS